MIITTMMLFHVLPESIFHTENKAGYGRGPRVAKRLFAKTCVYVNGEADGDDHHDGDDDDSKYQKLNR